MITTKGKLAGGGMIVWLIACLLALGIAMPAMAQAPASVYKGRVLVEVIDEFRSQGWPFAYSTGLVTGELVVQDEPDEGDALSILRQIIEPYNLVVRAEEGLYLIVRGPAAESGTGNLLLIVRDASDLSLLEASTVVSNPALAAGIQPAPGFTQYLSIAAKTYRLDVAADGFETSHRIVSVVPGETNVVTVELDHEAPEIENVTVSASRYELSRDLSNSQYFFDQRTIQTLPDVGDDTLRAAQKLPGSAAGGFSARTHFRGGEDTETGVILNGHQLFDPFHIRDYQDVFSTIDSRAIEGIEVYTGGFPARYGDQLSGLVVMESLDLTRPRHTELGLSMYNTSLLTAGVASDGDTKWLFSARRGNLDTMLNRRLGEPTYYDLFGEVSFSVTPDTRMSVNAMYADDSVLVILESEVDELEQAKSDTQNAQFWISLDTAWTDALSSNTVMAVNSFSNKRIGSANDIEKIVSSVDDRRDADVFAFRQDWAWYVTDSHLLQWGVAATYSEADYRYIADAEFFELQAAFEDVEETISRDLAAAADGETYSAFISDKWRILPHTVLELGLRWDQQKYTDLSDDSQFSPRFSILHGLGPDTEARLSWGRYYQSQGVHELQIEDGITEFFPAQRADHLIVGLRQAIGEKHSLRIEMFHKDMDDLRPRFENLFNPLALIPELTPDRVRLDPTEGEARGVEISLDRQGEPFNWWANYTWSEVTDTIDGVEQKRSWDQTHALQLGLNWNRDNWDLGFALNWHTGWPATALTVEETIDEDGEIEFIAIPGPRNAERYRTFFSLDLRIARRWDLTRGTLTAFFEASNVTGRNNVCCRDFDIEDDDDGNEFLESSNDYWLPFLPAVGILWEF